MVRRVFFVLAALALAGCATPVREPVDGRPRNIILMISDGSGYASLRATRLWSGRPLAVDAGGFRHAPMAVSQLSTRNQPIPGAAGLEQDPEMVFTPARGCDATPVEGETPALYGLGTSYPRAFLGYEWNRRTAPDSANTMSALVTGVRSYNNAINVDGSGAPVRSLAEAAAATGRAVGVVTTAAISDATPGAGGGAHSVNRALRTSIAAQMFGSGILQVIGGAGNPDWTDDATPASKPQYRWIGEDLWRTLKAGAPAGAKAIVWTLVEEAAPIADMAAGRAPVPDRLAMIARAHEGIQQYRGTLGPSTDPPFATPLLADQPSLADMAVAALRRLDRNPGGFLLVVEESNTDRASHANSLGRVIEARLSFEEAIRAIDGFLASRASRASLRDTLVIATADHDHLLLGPDGATVPFEPVADRGAGKLPGHRWLSNGHANLPVPLFARGPGAGLILRATGDGPAADLADGVPVPPAACPMATPYLDQAAVGRALHALLAGP